MNSIDDRLARLLSKTPANRKPPDWAVRAARLVAMRHTDTVHAPIGEWFIDELGNPTRIVGEAA